VPTDDATTALNALRILVAALSQSARAVEAHTGVTNAQLFVLRQLATAPTLSVNDLAERTRTRQNTVSSVVGRLVRAGLVAKVRSAADARRAALSLTPRGRRILAKAPASPTETLITGFDALAPRQLQGLARGLTALVDALDLNVDDAPMLFEDPRRRY
jgi:DNA-binding MarR family transcriptional regulator